MELAGIPTDVTKLLWEFVNTRVQLHILFLKTASSTWLDTHMPLTINERRTILYNLSICNLIAPIIHVVEVYYLEKHEILGIAFRGAIEYCSRNILDWMVERYDLTLKQFGFHWQRCPPQYKSIDWAANYYDCSRKKVRHMCFG